MQEVICFMLLIAAAIEINNKETLTQTHYTGPQPKMSQLSNTNLVLVFLFIPVFIKTDKIIAQLCGMSGNKNICPPQIYFVFSFGC